MKNKPAVKKGASRIPSPLVTIPFPPLFSFEECRWFLDRNLDDIMHEVIGDKVMKVILHDGKTILIEIEAQEKNLQINVLKGSLDNADVIIDYLREWFDMDRDIHPFYNLLERDKDLKVLKKNYRGLRLVGIPDLFELLCWCVMGQQINLAFAYKVKRAFVEKYGTKINYQDKTYYLFPEPHVIASLEIEDLKKLQLTARKAEYIKGISGLFVSGQLSKEILKSLGSEQKMKEHLMSIRGIGEWTANYAVMKGMGGMNCLPIGDSGINISLFNFKGIPKKENRKEVEKVFARFEGWKSYLVYYLWRSLRNPALQSP
jgi:DNA-3-methyladenine glycosylase II